MDRRTFTRSLGLTTTVGAAWLGMWFTAPAATAAPAACPAPGLAAIQSTDGTASCSARSDTGGAAAAYGIEATASADAAPSSLSLAIAQGGGVATSNSTFLSGPAAIAVGPDARVTTSGVRPGLSIGIAGPGATVAVTGVTAPTCGGGFGFAGDFQTGQACFSPR
ncbi:DUF6764 family protein [Nocardia beijingensis]|uniref:DUF6764 family protein n=1 Tax=Nocardia beijingensis TaxID=95162 RepID=UPI0018930B00|nr:DUF6764 family protein [Nocardia beijingensis]MBF6077645.1 protein kinase [Nocardia beijingensis]